MLTNRVGIVRVLLLAHVAGAVILILGRSHEVLRWTNLALVFTSILIIRLLFFGIEASDYLNLALLACTGVYYCNLEGDWPLVATGGISLVATLSYLIAGLSKLVSPYWGSGLALLRILDNATYGSTRLYSYFKTRLHLLRLIERLVIVAELCFPVAFVLPPPLLGITLSLWSVFHLAIAGIMGLNLFAFSYLATYPSIAVVAGMIGDWK